MDWGDGKIEYEDQSTILQPSPFTKIHQYSNDGSYEITITVSNMKESMSKNFSIMVVDCPAPDLTFDYGTPTNRLEYFRNAIVDVKATWEIENPTKCQEEVVANYTLISWNLEKINGNTKVSVASTSEGLQFKYNRIEYTIPKELPAADYNLELTTDFRGKRFLNTGYFKISDSKLVAHIQNEQYQTLAFKRPDEFGNITFYYFNMDGSGSKDPDESNPTPQDLDYKWQCRVLTNETFVNISKEVRLEKNATLNFNCLNRELENSDIVSTDQKPEFFTQNFLEDVGYEFQLTVTKDARKSVTKQVIYFSKGQSPQVALV